MPVIRISKDIKDKLNGVKIHTDESYNSVLDRVLNKVKVYKIDSTIVEVKHNGATVTIGNPVRERIIQD